jgi:hypothetical protein
MSCRGTDINAGPTGREDRGAGGSNRPDRPRWPRDVFAQEVSAAREGVSTAAEHHDNLKTDGRPPPMMLHRATRKPFSRETLFVHQATRW